MPRIAKTFSDPRSIPIFNLELGNARRLRIELFPRGSGAYFFDFDVSGTPAAKGTLRCPS